ncbi:MAG: ATP-binding cassette domain-containing protein, partial [Desulfovibrionales bacterium]|nr:ATP-binding cassette domain-containing protein [Desulfovibrionales bacterium]
MAVVSLNKVTKTFGNHVAVNDLSLEIIQGEFLTLLGPSGCGKTTVLRLIAGLEACDDGKIFIQDQDHTDIPASRRNVNTVFQSYALFPHMSVFDNVAFGLTLKKTPQKTITTRVEEALAMVRLSGMGHRRIDQLSGGQQQRVAIARAIVNHPLIL